MERFLLPAFLLAVILFSLFRKVPIFTAFCEGAGKALPLIMKLFPFLASVFLMTELMEVSGVSAWLSRTIAPLLTALGIPEETAPLLLVKPFSGSGSLGILADIYRKYGADGEIGRCASVVYGSSETVFYVSALYFAQSPKKQLLFPLVCALCIGFLSAVFGCFLLRLLG